MVNSIRDHLNEEDTISEIKLMLGQSKDVVCVVVEGEDDISLFNSLLLENVEVFQSYGSCIGIDEIIKTYFPKQKRVIGIKDKDYLKKPINKRIFFCDYSCLEMMIVSLDDCFDRIYSNCYKKSEYNSKELKLYCLKHLEILSKLRQLNFLLQWGIKFDGIKMSNCYNHDVSIMNTNIITEINKQNSNNLDHNKLEKTQELPECIDEKDYLNITNGHDFISLFNVMCKSKKAAFSNRTAGIVLRSTFGKEEFKKTELFSNLVDYQQEKGLSIVE